MLYILNTYIKFCANLFFFPSFFEKNLEIVLRNKSQVSKIYGWNLWRDIFHSHKGTCDMICMSNKIMSYRIYIFTNMKKINTIKMLYTKIDVSNKKTIRCYQERGPLYCINHYYRISFKNSLLIVYTYFLCIYLFLCVIFIVSWNLNI